MFNVKGIVWTMEILVFVLEEQRVHEYFDLTDYNMQMCQCRRYGGGALVSFYR